MMGCSPISSRILRKSSITSGAKCGEPEFLLDPQEFLFNRLPVLVFKGMEEVEVVSVQEFRKDSGIQIPGVRDPDDIPPAPDPSFREWGEGSCGPGSCRLPFLPASQAVFGSDGPLKDTVDIPDDNVILGKTDKGKLAREETADQGDPDPFRLLPGDENLSLRDVTELPKGLDRSPCAVAWSRLTTMLRVWPMSFFRARLI